MGWPPLEELIQERSKAPKIGSVVVARDGENLWSLVNFWAICAFAGPELSFIVGEEKVAKFNMSFSIEKDIFV